MKNIKFFGPDGSPNVHKAATNGAENSIDDAKTIDAVLPTA